MVSDAIGSKEEDALAVDHESRLAEEELGDHLNGCSHLSPLFGEEAPAS